MMPVFVFTVPLIYRGATNLKTQVQKYADPLPKSTLFKQPQLYWLSYLHFTTMVLVCLSVNTK